ncbi:MAG: hypothetical protein J1E34_06300 [Oscillospiraceae bacterium]|nr:hypothetical protein [Oscillospiraceae bacterium]
MFYTQNEGLSRDAKRTELEGAAARMIIARVKAAFIGSKLAIARLVLIFVSIAALLVPFGGVSFNISFFSETLSVGIIGIIKAVTGGLLLNIFDFLKSSLLGSAVLAAVIDLVCFAVIVVIIALILLFYFLSFVNLTKFTKLIKNTSLGGIIAGVLAQTACVIIKFTASGSELASAYFGFGGLACAAAFFALFLINRAMLKKGIEPGYSENDIKRREMLRLVRSGEVNLDDLPLPVFESEEERKERLSALYEALKAEEEGKEL